MAIGWKIRPPDQAVTWLSNTLGIDENDLVFAGGLIGHPDSPNATFNDGVESYGGALPFMLCMILLSGALVATVGNGDPERASTV
jgi:hypothetical protein